MVEMPVAVASSVLMPVHQRRVDDRDAFALEKVEELLRGVGRGEVRQLGRERRERIDRPGSVGWCARTFARSAPNWSSTFGPRVRVEYISSRPDFRCGARWMPTDRRLRTIWAAPSSKLTYSVRSPRSHAAAANRPESVDFAVPGAPEIRTLLPR